MVERLLRVSLNSDLLDLDEAVSQFIAKKQGTFKQYVEQKMKHHENRKNLGKLIN